MSTAVMHPLIRINGSRIPHLTLRNRSILLLTACSRLSSSYSHLQGEMTARTLPLVYDYFSPTSSHLLNISLAEHLPRLDLDSSKAETSSSPPRIPSILQTPHPNTLPPAHHLVYFPPAIPGPQLLPDGTDPLQSPGDPFTRRMWAGGRVRINNSAAAQAQLALDGRRVVCMEAIRDVLVKGSEGAEKIFVGVERRVGRCDEGEDEGVIRKRLWTTEEEDMGGALIVERRNIVFMRERKGDASAAAASSSPSSTSQNKTSAPPKKETSPPKPLPTPTYTHTLHPTAALLFRYSALSFNAHAIHLDPSYCRLAEGHRNTLVHGPLSFTLLVTALRFHLFQEDMTSGSRKNTDEREVVSDISYRNLAPLYCQEPVKLCGREMEPGKWEVWAETPEGGLAVRGVVKTERLPADQEKGELSRFGDLNIAALGL